MKKTNILNNKGFTLIEVLATITVIAIIGLFITNFVGSTLSISKNEAYKIMKNNVISSSYDYLKECETGQLECNLIWTDGKTKFFAKVLKNSGYFKNLESPIDGKNLETCLEIIATKHNESTNIEIVDNCY